jgi:NAD(P)-dependent dehydrogenase (short-subunit alcohol dehydrogenase family)
MAGKWMVADMPSLAGKVAVVTGSNRGLGLLIAKALAGAGAHVVMAVRDPAKSAAQIESVCRHAPGAKIDSVALDLADLASVRRAAAEIIRRFDRLDLLINNAAAILVPLGKTRDGFEMHIGVNHLGTFALTGLLIDRLMATPGARIVNMSSTAHRMVKGLDFDDFHYAMLPYKPMEAYGKSKLAALLFTFELDRRLRTAGADTIAVAAHPGYSNTNPDKGGLLLRIATALFAQPAQMGALPTLYAATSPDVSGGDYIGPAGMGEMRGHPAKVGTKATALDTVAAARLWALSTEQTGVAFLDGQPPK